MDVEETVGHGGVGNGGGVGDSDVGYGGVGESGGVGDSNIGSWRRRRLEKEIGDWRVDGGEIDGDGGGEGDVVGCLTKLFDMDRCQILMSIDVDNDVGRHRATSIMMWVMEE